MLHRIHAKAVDVCFAHPVAMCFDNIFLERQPVGGFVVLEPLQREKISILRLRLVVPIPDFSLSAIIVGVTQFDRQRSIGITPTAKRMLPSILIDFRLIPKVKPVVPGVIRNDIEENPHIPSMCLSDEFDEVFLCPKPGIDCQIILN